MPRDEGRDEYDDYADAVSPVGERTQTRTRARRGPFLGKLWAKFNALPAQTKVLILGAIIVVAIVIYLNVKGKKAAAAEDTGSQIPGQNHQKDKEPPPQPPAPNPPMPQAQPPIQSWGGYWPLGILDSRYQPVNQSGSTLGPGGQVGPLGPGPISTRPIGPVPTVKP